jgi:hypothetical protein
VKHDQRPSPCDDIKCDEKRVQFGDGPQRLVSEVRPEINLDITAVRLSEPPRRIRKSSASSSRTWTAPAM